jgi:hypothetical protein
VRALSVCDCTGYWEVLQVGAGGCFLGNDDTFTWQSEGTGTEGSVAWSAKAYLSRQYDARPPRTEREETMRKPAPLITLSAITLKVPSDSPRPRRIARRAPPRETIGSGLAQPNALRLRRLALALAFSVNLLVGCRTNSYVRDFDANYYWRNKSRLFSSRTPPEHLCLMASDQAIQWTSRCSAVSALFASYVPPGSTAQHMRSALPDTRWLSACSLEPAGALGGQIPVLALGRQSTFLLRLFPDEKGYSAWVVYLVLAHPSNTPLKSEDVLAFLKGAVSDTRITISEFAICYPGCGRGTSTEVIVSERFTRRGVGLSLSGW